MWPLSAEQRRYAALDALASLRCARAVVMLPKRSKPLLRPSFKTRSEEDEQENAARAPNHSLPAHAWGTCLSEEDLRGRLSL